LIANIGLWRSTNKLWEAGERQLQITQQSAEAATQSAITAERTLVAAHRPWIQAEVMVGGPIVYNVNGVNFNIKIRLKNIGRAPALTDKKSISTQFFQCANP
jgi:hypothetical protein